MRIAMTIVSIALLALAEPASAAESKSRTYTVSVSQHADITDPLNDRQVKEILAGASKILKDKGCDITFTLKGRVGGFGENRSSLLSVNESEIETVHEISADPNAHLHVKVVEDIGFCRSFEGDFNGCAWPINFRSIIVKRVPEEGSPPGDDRGPLSSFVWAHEFGHLMGIRHSLESNSLMTPCQIKKTDKEVTKDECMCYLAGPGTFGQCDLVHPSSPPGFCRPPPPR